MNTKRVNNLGRTVRAEASAWIVKLHGPDRSPSLEAGFRAWLAANPENAREFERVTEIWDVGAVPVPGLPRMRIAHNRRHAVRPRWVLGGALASLVIAVGTWRATAIWESPRYETGFGEQRIIRLADGSRITLNSDSSVVVSYRPHERLVNVDHGEAFFEVAKNPSRPFRVRAGDEEVVALGTAFDVQREPLEFAITLVDGKVAVSSLERPAPNEILTPGQRLRISNAGSPQIDEPSIDAVMAWRRGEVILDSTPLADAIAEMNRYDRRVLVIDDPSIGTIKISGIYHTGDSELFANMVARLYGLEVERQGDQIHLVTRPQTISSQR